MDKEDLLYFEKLKQQIHKVLLQQFSGIPEIREWKGQDIVNFQEDLFEKTKGSISEKWIYTHLKSETQKLPRIDMLNLLCTYAGYQDWNNFKANTKITVSDKRNSNKSLKKILFPILAILICAGLFILFFATKQNTCEFCFLDADLKAPIKNSKIEVSVLNDQESPTQYFCDANGCLILKTRKKELTLVVKSPYHKIDTIRRTVRQKSQWEQIRLKANDYALMIHYFSTSNVKDWKKRRNQLDIMIADNAEIYQIIDNGNIGMELYNKWEFINKMTMPVNSLRNIEIIDTEIYNDKIIMLRFKQLQNE